MDKIMLTALEYNNITTSKKKIKNNLVQLLLKTKT